MSARGDDASDAPHGGAQSIEDARVVSAEPPESTGLTSAPVSDALPEIPGGQPHHEQGSTGPADIDVGAAEFGEVTSSLGVLIPQPTVTLVEGSSFCVSDHGGEIDPERADGLFVRDTRVLSNWRLHIDSKPIEPLSVIPMDPYDCVFIGRAAPRPGHADATIIVERHRFVGQGMREDLTIRNYGGEAAGLDVLLTAEADFADLFHVKEHQFEVRRPVGHRVVGSDILYWLENSTDPRGVRITAHGARAADSSLLFRAVVPAQGSWTATIEVLPSVGGQEIAAAFPVDAPLETATPARRMRGWNAAAPRIRLENDALSAALDWSRRDLGALRIIDPKHPDDDVVAAGAPWFMALFGRDSLLTSWMMLPFFPELARGTLRTLARLQGSRDDVMTEEQPGRILHEVRLGAELALALGGESVYYGSIDSTPLFVALVGQALRWGAPAEELAELRPAVERALDWMSEFGDKDGDGFIEYQRTTDRGLLHQGWKDSFDSISYRDGVFARPSIALAEVQGYSYAAYLAKADLDEAWGDARQAARWRSRAAELKRRFHEAFWMPEHGFYAVALDRDKRPVDSITSNIGQCLWTGIVEEKVAGQVVERLISPTMFSGFGIRTLAADSGAFNPVSYHNGSIWPHDSALAASGIAAYGFTDEAERLIDGLLDTAIAFGGRLPELFCGFDRADKAMPVPYPTSCSPQAWAAAVPFELLRVGLGLQPDLAAGTLKAGPALALLGDAVVTGVEYAGEEVTVRVSGGAVEVT